MKKKKSWTNAWERKKERNTASVYTVSEPSTLWCHKRHWHPHPGVQDSLRTALPKHVGGASKTLTLPGKWAGFFLCKAVNTGLNMLLSGERACVYGGWFIVTGCVNKSTRKNVNEQHVRNWKIIPFIHFWPFYSQSWTAVMKENKHILMWEACNLECMATRDLINSEQPQNIRWDGRLFF